MIKENNIEMMTNENNTVIKTETKNLINKLFEMKKGDEEEMLAKNLKYAKTADKERHGKLIEMEGHDGEIITVREGCPHIREKSILKIDEYDIVIMEIAREGITLILRSGKKGATHYMRKRINKRKNGFTFRQRMQYGDALWWLEKLNYKKDWERLILDKGKDDTSYCVYEYWGSDRHEALFNGLMQMLNLKNKLTE